MCYSSTQQPVESRIASRLGPQELAPRQGQKSTIKELRKATWALIRYPSTRQVDVCHRSGLLNYC